MLAAAQQGTSPRNIVLVMIEPPLPFGNAAARWFYVLLKGLQERGHNVTAFAACSNPADLAAARSLFPESDFDLRLFLFPQRRGLLAKIETICRPYSYMFSREFKAALKQRLDAGYDILHMEHLWCGWLLSRQQLRTLVNVHYLFSIDLADEPRSTWKTKLHYSLMRLAERHLLRKTPHLLALSERIALAIKSTAPASKVDVVPLGLDLANYPFLSDTERNTSSPPVISVIGSMGWHPSRSAAIRLLTRLWPEIKRRVPTAKVQIVGWNAKTALRAYRELPDVDIQENVPDILPYFHRTTVLLYAPGRGSGMKVKVLESFALGVPVVTTSEGVEGLPAVDGIHAGIAEDDLALIERTVELLNSPALQNRQRHAARALLETHCSATATLSRLEQVYSQLFA